MTYANILAPLSDAKIAGGALETALVIGRKFSAHVDVLHVKTDPRQIIPYVGEGLSGSLVDEVVAAAATDSGKRENAANALFKSLIEKNGVPLVETPKAGFSVAWREDNGRDDERAAVWARTADLAVAPRPQMSAEASTTAMFEALVFEGGLPVILAPTQAPNSIGERILIGWNGGAECARAIASAMPFLETASAVRIVSMPGWLDGLASLQRVQERLAWRNIASEAIEVPGDAPVEIGRNLLDAAGEFNADLIVMGAYTQSRIRQMILGGVTRHVVSNAECCLFLER
ncbi:MAG: universal stress protein [Rhodospirillales bacterium]